MVTKLLIAGLVGLAACEVVQLHYIARSTSLAYDTDLRMVAGLLQRQSPSPVPDAEEAAQAAAAVDDGA